MQHRGHFDGRCEAETDVPRMSAKADVLGNVENATNNAQTVFRRGPKRKQPVRRLAMSQATHVKAQAVALARTKSATRRQVRARAPRLMARAEWRSLPRQRNCSSNGMTRSRCKRRRQIALCKREHAGDGQREYNVRLLMRDSKKPRVPHYGSSYKGDRGDQVARSLSSRGSWRAILDDVVTASAANTIPSTRS